MRKRYLHINFVSHHFFYLCTERALFELPLHLQTGLTTVRAVPNMHVYVYVYHHGLFCNN